MPSLKLCMNSCINLSACTHLQRVHHPGIATPPPTPLRASIFHGALSVMKHVHEWDGGGNYRENQAGSGRQTRAVKHPLSFFFCLFVLFVGGICRAFAEPGGRMFWIWRKHLRFFFFTPSVWGSIFGPEGTIQTPRVHLTHFGHIDASVVLQCVCCYRWGHPGWAGAADTTSSRSSNPLPPRAPQIIKYKKRINQETKENNSLCVFSEFVILIVVIESSVKLISWRCLRCLEPCGSGLFISSLHPPSHIYIWSTCHPACSDLPVWEELNYFTGLNECWLFFSKPQPPSKHFK